MKLTKIILFLITLCWGVAPLSAQKKITVSGRVLQQVYVMENDKKVLDTKPLEYVHIYSIPDQTSLDFVICQYENIGDRNVLWEILLGLPPFDRPQKEAVSAADGTYTIENVPENGYLVFLPYSGKARTLAINGRMEVEDVVFDTEDLDSGIICDPVPVDWSSDSSEVGAKIPEEIIELLALDKDTTNWDIVATASFPMSEKLLKKSSRVVMRPYIVDGRPSTAPVDTMFFTPFECEDPEILLEKKNEIIFYNVGKVRVQQIAEEWEQELPMRRKYVVTRLKGLLPQKDREYKGEIEILYEKRGKPLEKDTFVIKHYETKEPMLFLEYEIEPTFLDPANPEFKVQPIEYIDSNTVSGKMNLTFMVGRAELDSKNPNNKRVISRLQNEMLTIENEENKLLRTLTIVGKTSPEGDYESNKVLAAKRIAVVSNRIKTAFNPYTCNRLKITEIPVVAGWEEVADSMEADELVDEATAIRKIVAANKDNLAKQYTLIRALPYYNSIIKEVYLPKLRTVEYKYTYQTRSSLTDKEILNKWQLSKEAKDKVTDFNRYEFWRLANLVKDAADLHKIYKRYYEYTKNSQRIPDLLAACNYAAFLIRDGISDTTILKPFIKMNRRMNYRQLDVNEEWENYNREEVLVNQMAMYFYGQYYWNADILRKKLPNTENNALLKAIMNCKMGYYRQPENYEPVAAISPNNRIVILIALKQDLKLAQTICEEELDAQNPRKYYFLAQISKMLGEDYRKVVDYLGECFKLDESYLEIADMDATFMDNKGKKPEYEQAKSKYLNWKKENASGNVIQK